MTARARRQGPGPIAARRTSTSAKYHEALLGRTREESVSSQLHARHREIVIFVGIDIAKARDYK